MDLVGFLRLSGRRLLLPRCWPRPRAIASSRPSRPSPNCRSKTLYEQSLPDLESMLARCYEKTTPPPGQVKLFICFGQVAQADLMPFARLLFDWYRVPILRVTLDGQGYRGDRAHRAGRHQHAERGGARLLPAGARGPHRPHLGDRQDPDAGQVHPRRAARSPGEAAAVRDQESIRHFAKVAQRFSIDVEPITRRATSTSLPNTMRCSSARPPRSTTTPIALPGAPSRRACRSSTTRNR